MDKLGSKKATQQTKLSNTPSNSRCNYTRRWSTQAHVPRPLSTLSCTEIPEHLDAESRDLHMFAVLSRLSEQNKRVLQIQDYYRLIIDLYLAGKYLFVRRCVLFKQFLEIEQIICKSKKGLKTAQ